MEPCLSGLRYLFAKEVRALNPSAGSNPAGSALKLFMTMKGKITLKAMCIFQKDGQILVSKGFDKVKNETFYRFLGEHINFFESGEKGIRREIQEELKSDIKNLKFIDIVENLFIYQGEKYHEIDFIYSGDLVKKELYNQTSIHIIKETHEFDAEWFPIKDIFTNKIPLYPKFNYKELFKP